MVNNKIIKTDYLNECFGGLIILFIMITYVLSLSLIIHSGEFSFALSFGVINGFLATAIMNFILHLRSAKTQSLFVIQDVPSIILFGLITSLSVDLKGDNIALFSNVFVITSLIGILSGFGLILIAYFDINKIAKFFPFTVIAGYLTACGVLLIKSAILNVLNKPVTIEYIYYESWRISNLSLWLPTIVVGVFLFLISKTSFFIKGVSLFFVSFIISFILFKYFKGYTFNQLEEFGYIISMGGISEYIEIVTSNFDFNQINWNNTMLSSARFFEITVVAAISMILNSSAYENIYKKDYKLTDEFFNVGLSNCVSGIFSGIVGYSTMFGPYLNYTLKTKTRIPIIITISGCLIFILFGKYITNVIPTHLIYGFTFYLGLSLCYDWLINTRKKINGIEFYLVPLIAIIIIVFGFKEGLFFGVLLNFFVFVYNYLKIPSVFYKMDGSLYPSKVQRSAEEEEIIRSRGKDLFILKLQGYLFFATSDMLLSPIKERFECLDKKKPRFIILDFSLVRKIDYSAKIIFDKLINLCEKNECLLFLSDVDHDNIKDSIINQNKTNIITFFKSLNDAVEFFEKMILKEKTHKISSIIEKIFLEQSNVEKIISVLEKKVFYQSEILFKIDELSFDMFFITKGSVDILSSNNEKLITLSAGTFMGELSFINESPRTATAKVAKNTELYQLKKNNFNKITNNKELMNIFEKYFFMEMSRRLSFSNRLIEFYSTRIGTRE